MCDNMHGGLTFRATKLVGEIFLNIGAVQSRRTNDVPYNRNNPLHISIRSIIRWA